MNEVEDLYKKNNLEYTIENFRSEKSIKNLIPFIKNDKKNDVKMTYPKFIQNRSQEDPGPAGHQKTFRSRTSKMVGYFELSVTYHDRLLRGSKK